MDDAGRQHARVGWPPCTAGWVQDADSPIGTRPRSQAVVKASGRTLASSRAAPRTRPTRPDGHREGALTADHRAGDRPVEGERHHQVRRANPFTFSVSVLMRWRSGSVVDRLEMSTFIGGSCCLSRERAGRQLQHVGWDRSGIGGHAAENRPPGAGCVSAGNPDRGPHAAGLK